MNMRLPLTSQKKRGAVALLLIGTLLALGAGKARAVTNAGPIGLQISPVKVEVNVDPGQSYTFKVTPFNITTKTLTLSPVVNDFTSKDETGSPQVLLDGSLPASSSLKNWLTLSDSSKFQLAPKTSKPIIVTLKVPTNAEPGGHYGIVRFSGAGSNDNEDNVSLIASWGTLVLVRVNGDIKEKLETVDFNTARQGKRTALFEKGPVDFVVRLKNIGNVHVKPKGSIVIKDMFGKQVGSVAVNKADGNVLPNSTRRFEETFKKSGMFGRYTAKFDLAYGTRGQIVSGSLSFWVIPYKIITFILIILTLAIWLIVKGIKRYNRNIVKKAMNQQNKGS